MLPLDFAARKTSRRPVNHKLHVAEDMPHSQLDYIHSREPESYLNHAEINGAFNEFF